MLQTGTVTLLLAGAAAGTSTKGRIGEIRLHEVVMGCAQAHGGGSTIERAKGGGVLCAFSRVSDAVGCALALQRALTDDGAGLVVAIAIHTGEVGVDDRGQHRGGTLDRCARLRDLAHGGQILLSRASSELVVDRLPSEVTLEDLGSHQLQGLVRRERVFQACHPDLVTEFPPLVSAAQGRHNLPPQLTSFVGRAAELAQLAEALSEARTLTLTGAGGCGKSRLALQVASARVEDFVDGVWWVDLGSIADPALVAASAASVLTVREVPSQDVRETLARQLEDRHLLLVLDNCEHLLSACAELTERLLRSCPRVSVLCTSREPLGVAGEVTWRVSSLPFPGDGVVSTPVELTSYDAVRLFVERAARVRPNFRLTVDNAPGVALVCRRLDGIPLALELAAAQARVLSPQQIADELVDSFRLITGGQRGALSRQQTLEASVEWSYHLLASEERVLMARLSVFAGGFTLEAAEAVCAGEGIDSYRVLDVLGRLVDKSLVQVEGEVGSRYRLLETIRYFANRHLVDNGEVSATRDRHLRFFSELAAEQSFELQTFGWTSALRRLTEENDNLRAAIDWGLESEDPDLSLRIVGGLYQYWRIRGHFAEGLTWARAAFARSGAASTARLDALLGAAGLCAYTGDFLAEETWAQEALRIARVLGDQRGIGRALNALAFPTMYLNPPARALYEEAIAIHRDQDDPLYLAASLYALAYLEINAGNLTAARRCAAESVEVARQVGARLELLGGLNFLGWAASIEGDFAVAEAAFTELISAAHELGESFWDSLAMAQLAGVAVFTGDYGRAEDLLGEALRVGRESANLYTLAASLWYLGELAYAQGDFVAAVPPLEEAVPLLLVTPHSWAGALVQVRIGDIAVTTGDTNTAVETWEAAMATARQSANPVALGRARQRLARIARWRDDLHRADELVHDALAGYLACGDRLGVVEAIEDLAALAADLESWAEAARLLGAAEAARDATGYVRRPSEAPSHAGVIDRLRDQLGDDDLSAAWAEGRALSLEAAAAYARKRRGSRKRPSAGWASLTPTELQVAHLVAEGLTNPAIAERLFISRGTVKVHLSHIFTKLSVTNRTELAALTIRRET